MWFQTHGQEKRMKTLTHNKTLEPGDVLNVSAFGLRAQLDFYKSLFQVSKIILLREEPSRITFKYSRTSGVEQR